jgi:hypothetical protein
MAKLLKNGSLRKQQVLISFKIKYNFATMKVAKKMLNERTLPCFYFKILIYNKLWGSLQVLACPTVGVNKIKELLGSNVTHHLKNL